MKSILCDENELNKAEPLNGKGYFISSRIATLFNLSESISKFDFDKPRISEFKTILNPSADLQKKYRSILEGHFIEEFTEKETQTLSVKKAEFRKSKPAKQQKNFIKNNKSDLRASSSSVSSRPSSLKPTPREKVKSNKHVKIAIPNSNIVFDPKAETDVNILSIIYKQFSDLVLLQWEEAADLLIDELLEEEIEHLNMIEDCPKTENDLPSSLEGILEELNRMESFKSEMKEKYLRK